MNDIRIPQHVIQRLEPRWMGKLEQLSKMQTRLPMQPMSKTIRFVRLTSNDGWQVL
jgi:hypothetical protein